MQNNKIFEIRISNTCIWNTARPCLQSGISFWSSCEAAHILALSSLSNSFAAAQFDFSSLACSKTLSLKNATEFLRLGGITTVASGRLQQHLSFCRVFFWNQRMFVSLFCPVTKHLFETLCQYLGGNVCVTGCPWGHGGRGKHDARWACFIVPWKQKTEARNQWPCA